ncbi:oocyte-secreted protein 4A-like [Papio anubis]|uniref:oocyte-secreted protein 4A-like n=1 Tax=Papio anubis TaxID=9555 RepID=UPI000B7B67C7|nr:oocyte-secreted protein 4A-like [Papio anubis]
MKISGVLGGLLILFASTHALENMFVECTESWLLVEIRRAPLVENLQPQHYELSLGNDCPVTRVTNDIFEFRYGLDFCGIMKYERPWGILIESFVMYQPMFLNIRTYIPVRCSLERKPPLLEQNVIQNNTDKSKKTVQTQYYQAGNLCIQEYYLGAIFSLVGLCNFYSLN